MSELRAIFNERSKYYLNIYFLVFAADMMIFGIEEWTSLNPFKVVPMIIAIIIGNIQYHRENKSSREVCMTCLFNTMGIVLSILTMFILLAVLFWSEARIDVGHILFY